MSDIRNEIFKNLTVRNSPYLFWGEGKEMRKQYTSKSAMSCLETVLVMWVRNTSAFNSEEKNKIKN